MSDQLQPPVYKIALGIEYDGSKYYGWQRQNEVRSVQESWKKHSPRLPMSRLPSSAPGVPMLAFTAPGRSSISKRPHSEKTRRGR